jgi:hypothetical protein
MPSECAPKWVAEAELDYNLPRDVDFKQCLKEKGLVAPDFATHVGGRKGNGKITERYHEVGAKVLPYVTYSNRFYIPEKEFDEDTWKFRALTRPELFIYNEKSTRERSLFADQKDHRRTEICPNTHEMVEVAEQEVEELMRMGYDGFFVDHGFGPTKCHGEALGIHRHIYHEEDIGGFPESYLRYSPGAVDAPNDDPLGAYAYGMLLRRVQKTMDRHGSENILILNTTYWPFYYSPEPFKKFVMYAPKNPRIIPGVIWESGHCMMVESHVCVPEWLIRPDSKEKTAMRWGNFALWHRLDETPKQHRDVGKRIVCLPGFGGSKLGDLREDAFYCYALGKTHNMIWNAHLGDPTEEFCRFKMGKPLEDECSFQDGIYYRVFEKGAVAVNPDTMERKTGLQVGVEKATDLFRGEPISCRSKVLDVTIPPEGGRIYLW